ncbi:hypothetical protein [Stenomitos frigidus]|uniref:Glycosyltransferase subfamily 4-like N-terminal domain-containing protein n=1 Tax=Stenomitos frigidus ULC18 TaxID=2107698 RepID=A0A2T1E251_9CYAN|nr:hypothetical protein [Stenomitos frigidus]PSB26704.1 hypothetical protein C7B82_19075 [Stenomitos frigidus ULC18]
MTTSEPSIRSLHRVLVYTDAMGLGGAEISLGHLIAQVANDLSLTVVGVSPSVVSAIASHRPGTTGIVLPATGLSTIVAHLTTFHYLQPDKPRSSQAQNR